MMILGVVLSFKKEAGMSGECGAKTFIGSLDPTFAQKVLFFFFDHERRRHTVDLKVLKGFKKRMLRFPFIVEINKIKFYFLLVSLEWLLLVVNSTFVISLGLDWDHSLF